MQIIRFCSLLYLSNFFLQLFVAVFPCLSASGKQGNGKEEHLLQTPSQKMQTPSHTKITNKEIVNLIDTVTKCKRFVSKVQIEYIVIAETRMLVSAEFGKQKRPNSQFWRRWKYIKSAKLQQQLHCRKSFCLSRISSCQSCFCSGKKSLLMKRNIWRVR